LFLLLFIGEPSDRVYAVGAPPSTRTVASQREGRVEAADWMVSNSFVIVVDRFENDVYTFH